MGENTTPMIIKLIESEGYKVVDAKRLAALERLYEASRRREYADEADEWQTAELEATEDGNA